MKAVHYSTQFHMLSRHTNSCHPQRVSVIELQVTWQSSAPFSTRRLATDPAHRKFVWLRIQLADMVRAGMHGHLHCGIGCRECEEVIALSSWTLRCVLSKEKMEVWKSRMEVGSNRIAGNAVRLASGMKPSASHARQWTFLIPFLDDIKCWEDWYKARLGRRASGMDFAVSKLSIQSLYMLNPKADDSFCWNNSKIWWCKEDPAACSKGSNRFIPNMWCPVKIDKLSSDDTVTMNAEWLCVQGAHVICKTWTQTPHAEFFHHGSITVFAASHQCRTKTSGSPVKNHLCFVYDFRKLNKPLWSQ